MMGNTTVAIESFVNYLQFTFGLIANSKIMLWSRLFKVNFSSPFRNSATHSSFRCIAAFCLLSFWLFFESLGLGLCFCWGRGQYKILLESRICRWFFEEFLFLCRKRLYQSGKIEFWVLLESKYVFRHQLLNLFRFCSHQCSKWRLLREPDKVLYFWR